MILKKIFSRVIILGFISALALTSCSDSDKKADKIPTGSVTLQSGQIDHDKRSQFLDIAANTDWVLTFEFDNSEDQEEPWCYIEEGVTEYRGSGNKKDIVLKTSINGSYTDRHVTLTLKTSSGTVLTEITITQTGNPNANPLKVALRESVVSASDESQFVIVTCNNGWSLSVDYPEGTTPWVTGFEPSTGTGNTSNVTVWFTANTTGATRTANIILTSEGESVQTTLTQNSGTVTNDPVLRLSSPEVSSTETSQTIIVQYTNEWTLNVTYPVGTSPWCSISSSDTQGTGNKSVTLSYTVNDSESDRTATINLVATNGGATSSVVLTQKGKQATPTQTGWLELPAMTNLSPTEKFVTHYTTISNKKVRNYSLMFDTKDDTKIAYWVAYPHHLSYIGDSGRTNAWGYDPTFTSSEQPNMGSGLNGYDRGHQIPSGDRTANKETNRQTFYYTNMTAQLAGLNQKVWQGLENNYVREKWLKSTTDRPDTLYIVTGAILNKQGENRTVTKVKDNSGKNLAVPNYYFKAILYRKGNSYRAIGFWFEHKDYGSNAAANLKLVLQNQAVSIRTLESYTGFDFFPELKNLTSDWDRIETTVTLSAWGLN